MIIYKFTNNLNGKVYIGQTTRPLQERVAQHLNSKDFTHFHCALRKYGVNNFTVEEIDCADSKKELDEKEIFWISHYNSTDRLIGYNSTYGGDTNAMDCQISREIHDSKMRSSEVRNKISDTMSKYRADHPFSDEHRSNLSESMRGNTNFLGHKRSADAIEKTAMSLRKGIYCVNAEGAVVAEFDSVKSACIWFGEQIGSDSTPKVIHKKIKRSANNDIFVNGLKWVYKV